VEPLRRWEAENAAGYLEAAPDYAEPIVGWRVWLAIEERDALRLRSVLYYDVWPPGREMVALCRAFERDLLRPWRRKTHAAPSERCLCGIYASWEVREAVDYLQGLHRPGGPVVRHVVGLASLWGTVVECERGWRASHAYPVRIYVPERRTGGEAVPPAKEIARRLAVYGVPVAAYSDSRRTNT